MYTREPTTNTNMSRHELAELHAEDAIYYRVVRYAGSTRYSVYAGDGTYLDAVDSLSDILKTAQEFDLQILTLH